MAYDKNGNFFTLEDVLLANEVKISQKEVPYKHGNTGYVYTGETESWYDKTYTKNDITYNITKKNSDSVKSDMKSKGISNFEDYLAQILIDHPEGLCYYKNGHYVVITDYEYDVTTGKYIFYLIDGVNEFVSGYKKGRVELSETYLCQERKVKSIKGNVGLIAYINEPAKPVHICPMELGTNNYATKNDVLGACRECGRAYNWQNTFQKITKLYELKSSNKKDKVKVHKAPYEDAEVLSNTVNEKFTVLGTVTNAYNNKWYVVDYADDAKKVCYIAYVYSEHIDNKYRLTSFTAEAKKYGSGNTSAKSHTHNYNYDNGYCYCGEKKSSARQNEESTLKISLTKYPMQHTEGNNFGLRGTISSNYDILTAKGYVINSEKSSGII